MASEKAIMSCKQALLCRFSVITHGQNTPCKLNACFTAFVEWVCEMLNTYEFVVVNELGKL